MFHELETKTLDFDALRLKLASPERIREWSHGEVTKAETVNYRTQKPEKDGLFDERIFGPSKDWECYCGKYKKVRYKGIVCDKCGVEVTRSVVRRERMGHIELASPVSHIWFLRGVPSRIGLMLDLSLQNLEKVVYFASFIVTKVDEDAKKATLEQIRQEYKSKRRKLEEDCNRQAAAVRNQVAKANPGLTGEALAAKSEAEFSHVQRARDERLGELESVLRLAEAELKDLKPMKILSEHQYQDLSLKYGHLFEAGIGAEAIRQLLEDIDLEQIVASLNSKVETAHGPLREKLTKRLRLASDLLRNKIQAEWMVLTTVPVIPPDLRPMVPLDGGRFATSDLNDLYRRIINRNNRLKQLVELNAPEVICRNEKRMLQEAVDALIDNNARRGKTVVASTGQKRMLKSLADILRGKQGRFRQNLLGKRIDYSGRSVIVVGPKLKLNQCGLPKKMALELFKPFIIAKIIKAEFVHNVRSASRFIESGRPEVWDILEEIVREAYVLLNRAPTLHRLGIQAFKPTLIEGKAIQVHPLVCAAFNADFDGDQMAVHVPLTEEAKREAAELMLSTKNLLKPATGAPITNPTMDMVWGCYYMTTVQAPPAGRAPKIFSSASEAYTAYQLRHIRLQDQLQIPASCLERTVLDEHGKKLARHALVTTSVGRILFNELLPEGYPYVNALLDKKSLARIVGRLLEQYSFDEAAAMLDKIKEFGFRYLTRSGFSWGMDDVPALTEKRAIIEQGDREVAEINDQYDMGLLTDSERHTKVIETWMKIKDNIVAISRQALDPGGPIYSMVESGARGSWSQLIQIMGMKGLVTNPAGEIIELPVKGNFKEGFDVLEYFISTHGARKGLSDTALRTANAGYLTRRLVDVAQDLVITSEDCGDTVGFTFSRAESHIINLLPEDRVLNRFSLQEITAPRAKKPLLAVGDLITPAVAEQIKKLNLAELKVRSVLSCRNRRGVCQKCYGYDLGYSQLVKPGTSVGIIAAQSIGEPGTQLTMRTFHTGGVAGLDITQGLPRVEEIFEARSPKMKAFVSEVAGKVTVKPPAAGTRQKLIVIAYTEMGRDVYPFGIVVKGKGKKKAAGGSIAVKEGNSVEEETVLGTNAAGEKVLAKRAGVVHLEDAAVVVVAEQLKTREYLIPSDFTVVVKSGELVGAGDRLTDGSLDLRQLYRLKGMSETQRYILREIQSIYTSQGQQLNDKHVELIIRQMFSRVQVKDAGDTPLLASSRLEWAEFLAINNEIAALSKRPAAGERLLLGITKVSLSTSSFLSAASFQETSRVLINAAVQGRIDYLEGLKENVIIGRLIPAGTGFRPPTHLPAGSTPVTDDGE